MYRKVHTLTLQGKPFQKSELLQHCEDLVSSMHTENWERNIAMFIFNWLDGEKYLEVKTSGTTGVQKTIYLKKDHMVNSARMTIDFLGLVRGTRALLCMPAEYIAGKMMIVRAMTGDWDLYCVKPGSNPLMSVPENTLLDFTAITPMQLAMILSDAQSRKKLNGMKKILVGGAGIPLPLVEKCRELKVSIYETYGMTETISHIAMKKINGTDASDYFQVLDGVTIEKDDKECLVINAPHLSDEKIITQDMVTILDKKSFRFMGRYDNMINSGGIKVFPESIEKKLSPYIITEFYITSMKDVLLGEKVVLVMEGNAFCLDRQEELLEKCRKVLNKYETPRAIIFCEKLQRSAGGKLIRERF